MPGVVRIRTRATRAHIRRAMDALDGPTILRLIGERHRQWIDDNFREEGKEVPWRPLSPNTVAARRRGSNRVLQDTGQLRQNWTVRVGTSSVEVGTNQEQAPYHHFGTRPYTILPRRARLLRFRTVEGMVAARRVEHPGLPRRPLLPSVPLGTKLAVDVADAAVRVAVRG